MYKQTTDAVLASAKKQSEFLKGNPWGYLVSALISGIFISLSTMLSAMVSVQNQGSPVISLLGAAMSPLGLILVVFTGTMLFTGNTFTISFGAFMKRISWLDALKILAMVYIGNWLGTLLLSFLYTGTGHLQGDLANYYIATFGAKQNLSFLQILIRGLLCNTLVCAATWAYHRFESFSAKFLIIFFALLGMVGTGFENSISNMSQGSLALLVPGGWQEIGILGYLRTILSSTIGNLMAGVLIFALPMWLLAKETRSEFAEE